MASVCIILTATVLPDAGVISRSIDPLARLAEYEAAIRHAGSALRHLPGVRIIVAENSGAEEARLAQICAEAGVDLHVKIDQSNAARAGKGAGEIRLIEMLLEDEGVAGVDRFLKITGRHRITNLKAVVSAFQRSDADIWSRLNWPGTFADSRVFGFSRRGFALVQEAAQQIDDANGYYLEHALAAAIRGAKARALRWRCLPVYPVIIGSSGATGEVYRTGTLQVLAERARLALLRLGHRLRG